MTAAHIPLELLFNSTRGDQWRWQNEAAYGPKWSFSSPQADPCNDQSRVWQGITCSFPPSTCKTQSCEIVSLVLFDYKLEGTLPSQFFVLLPSLKKLTLSLSEGLTGSLPSELGSLSQLTGLYMDNNQLTGSLPSEIGSLSMLGVLSLEDNQLSGSIPPELGSLSRLGYVSLCNNQLTGVIPLEIGSLSRLAVLYLYLNRLTGPIPSELGSLLELGVLSLHINQLSGPIPSELSSLSYLDVLSLYKNELTGPIPSELGSLSFLGSLYLYWNRLTGAIPSELCSLSRLGNLHLHRNQLTGAIPSQIGLLSRLDGLSLSRNRLTGPLPSEIGSLSLLHQLYLDNNHFVGAIPLSISSLVELVDLHLHHNQLSGPISLRLVSFPQLRQLFLHQNRFTGRLSLLFPSNTSFPLSELLNLDVSDNLLSGSVPSALFLVPRLQSISLSLNCFEHHLPSAICEATNAHVISMDGLGSAKGCQQIVPLPFPFTSVTLVRSISGRIPHCVWSMSNLRILNLAGNGFEGKIGNASSLSSLLSLTLSHNHLSGEIPLWLIEKTMPHLDLSHNKLTGEITGGGFKYHSALFNITNPLYRELVNATLGWEVGSQQSLRLNVNRLSGDVPTSLGRYADLEILSGNLFSCDSLPKNDKNSESVSCGSEQYDQSMALMGGVFGMVCLVALSSLVCRLLLSSFKSHDDKTKGDTQSLWFTLVKYVDYGTLLRYVSYAQAAPIDSDPRHMREEIDPPSPSPPPPPPPHPLQSIFSFGSLLSRLMWSVCVLVALCFLLSLPVYVLKQLDIVSASEGGGETQYVTHTHMYSWLWTMAFVSGSTPAIILLLTNFLCLSYFNLVMNRLGGNEVPSRLVSPSAASPLSMSKAVWTILFLNIAVVGTVNGLYIWSTLLDLESDDRVWIQISFALFSFLWSAALPRGLSSEIKDSRHGVWLFLCLNAMNSVLIPCAVTALSTPTCYQVSLPSHDPSPPPILCLIVLWSSETACPS
jgi:Leucine-rich repeat (LRR) protein